MNMNIERGAIALGAFGLLAGCVAGLNASETRFTVVDSSSSSWVARGYSDYTVSGDNGWSFDVSRIGNRIRFRTDGVALPGTGVSYWDMTFAAAFDAVIVPGLYEDFQRWPFQDSDRPGLSFSSTGRLDNMASGFFEVWQADYDTNGDLLAFAADFTHYGEQNLNNWAMVEVRYNATVPAPAGIGVFAVVGGLSACRRRR